MPAMAQRLQFLFRSHTFSTRQTTPMARQLPTTRQQDRLPARAPAFRAAQPSGPDPAPGATPNRRFPRAPAARPDAGASAPVIAPSLHVRDVPPRWYGIGGTG